MTSLQGFTPETRAQLVALKGVGPTVVGRLEQIGGALDASLARSDEQLAYYVAQAREVVDLSLLSQKQVMEELQQLAARRGKAGSA